MCIFAFSLDVKLTLTLLTDVKADLFSSILDSHIVALDESQFKTILLYLIAGLRAAHQSTLTESRCFPPSHLLSFFNLLPVAKQKVWAAGGWGFFANSWRYVRQKSSLWHHAEPRADTNVWIWVFKAFCSLSFGSSVHSLTTHFNLSILQKQEIAGPIESCTEEW